MTNGIMSKITHADIMGCISALLCIIGAFLPWIHATVIFAGSFTKTGVEGDGIFTLVFGLICLGLFYIGIMRQKRLGASIGIIVFSIFNILIMMVDTADILDRIEIIESSPLYGMGVVQIGIGVHITIIGSIGLLISGLWNLCKNSKSRPRQNQSVTNQPLQNNSRHCPNCGRPIDLSYQLCPYCGKDFRLK